MKNIKRTVAVFVSAIMVMAMLTGCGGSSLKKQLLNVTGASSSSSLDKVTSALANTELTETAIKAAVEGYGEIIECEVETGTTGSVAYAFTYDLSTGAVVVDGFIIIQYTDMTTDEILEFFSKYKAADFEEEIKAVNSDMDCEVYISAMTTGTDSGIIVMDISVTGATVEEIMSAIV